MLAPLNTPHVAPHVVHQNYPYILLWAADQLATPQQKFPVGSPANVKGRKVPAEQAPHVLEPSTLLLRDDEIAGQVMDLASPPWAPASVLALHVASGLRDAMSVCSPQEFLRTSCLPEASLAVWTATGEVATPAPLGGFLVDDALSPLPANSAAPTTKEVQDKLVDGDCVPIDPLLELEAAVGPGPAVPDDGQLPKLTKRQTCDTLQATEDALRSAREDLVHQRKMHDAATERLHSPIDDLKVQVTKLVQTLDRNRTSTEEAGTVDTRIQPATKTLLSLAHKLPPPGTQVPDALQSALEKLRPANYRQIDNHHAAWYPSLPVLLTAWVARGSPTFQDLHLFFAQFDSTLDIPPPAATLAANSPRESPIVDLTGVDDPVPSASPMPTNESVTVTAGIGTWTGASRHAGGDGGPWKESGNIPSSQSGTVCDGVGLRAGAGGAAAAPLPGGTGAADAPGADRCAEPPLPLVKCVQGCLEDFCH